MQLAAVAKSMNEIKKSHSFLVTCEVIYYVIRSLCVEALVSFRFFCVLAAALEVNDLLLAAMGALSPVD